MQSGRFPLYEKRYRGWTIASAADLPQEEVQRQSVGSDFYIDSEENCSTSGDTSLDRSKACLLDARLRTEHSQLVHNVARESFAALQQFNYWGASNTYFHTC
eukprot:931427-Amphidinium_carterae.1